MSSARSEADRRDAGMSLVELVVAMSLLGVLGVMAGMVMIGTQRAAGLVAWRANAGSEIRHLLDATFAELSSARPPAACTDASCDRITEAAASSGILLAASDRQVCYASQREDPVGSGDSLGVLTPFWKVCLVVATADPDRHLAPSERLLLLDAYPPVSAVYGQVDVASAFAPDPQRRELGVIDVGDLPVFSYVDIGGHDVAGSQLGAVTSPSLGTSLATVARVKMRIRLSTYDTTGRRTATRQHEFSAALRTTRYQQERYWNDAAGTAGTPP